MVILFVLLLALLSWLSKYGIVRYNPITGSALLPVQSLIWQRCIAILLMLPAVVYTVIAPPLWTGWNTESLYLIIGATAIIIPGGMLITHLDKNPSHARMFGVLRSLTPYWYTFCVSTTLYMIFYEIVMRGYVLGYLLGKLPVVAAVGVNVLIYALMHLYKDRREALMSIPLGIGLCYLTIYSGSVWPAVWFHTLMALIFELLYSRKQMPPSTQ